MQFGFGGFGSLTQARLLLVQVTGWQLGGAHLVAHPLQTLLQLCLFILEPRGPLRGRIKLAA